MFTGIIQTTSKVKNRGGTKEGLVLSVARPKGWKIKVGDSININGVCSTVVRVSSNLEFQYMPETLRKSNLSGLKVGDVVNLEQSLKLGERLDGHMVLGHVDTLGTIRGIKTEGNSKVFTVTLSGAESRLVAAKGSVTVEGISLTVVQAQKNFFTVHIIPHTLSHTNLEQKKTGDMVNVEFDVLAKYTARLLNK